MKLKNLPDMPVIGNNAKNWAKMTTVFIDLKNESGWSSAFGDTVNLVTSAFLKINSIISKNCTSILSDHKGWVYSGN